MTQFNHDEQTACLKILRADAKALSLTLDEQQQQQCIEYIKLLTKWNASFNLTAIREPTEMARRHIIDSLTILPYIDVGAHTLIDVGSGAGLPGLMIAIMRPDIQVTLLDSSIKKTRFLLQAKLALQLEHCHIEQHRVETFSPEVGYDYITSRAFASLEKTLQQTEHLAHLGTRWLAMKAKDSDTEVAALNPSQYTTTTQAISLPNSDVTRHLVIIQQNR